VPRKNVRILAGRSLLQWTQAAIAEARLDAPCLLTTDDEEIAAAGRELGWLVPFLRPAELARDDSPTEPAVLHALDWFARHRNGDPEMVLVLQVTSPLRGGACLRQGLELLRNSNDGDAVVGMREISAKTSHLFIRDGGGTLSPLRRADGSGPVFVPNGALYVIRTPALRRHRTLFPPGTLPLVMGAGASLDIDTEQDWALAEALADRIQEKRPA
jgi:CMP-N-acetylneuraminic acid synthetase